MSDGLLLGIDEGTTAVKAALFDRDLRPWRARASVTALRIPGPGLVEQDPELILEAVSGRGRRGARAGRGRKVARGRARPSGRVGAGLGRRERPRADAGGRLAGQAPRRDARGDRPLALSTRSGLPLDPYFSAGKLAWLVENDARGRAARATAARCGSGRWTRSLPIGSAGALRPTSRRPRARSCSRSAGATGTSSCLRAFGLRARVAAGDRADLRARSASCAATRWPVAAAAGGAARRPAGGARRLGRGAAPGR